MSRQRVVILGGGLAGLSAGIHLLQEGGAERFDVTLLSMEPRLGGKAASWRHADGRYMEVGFHAIFGYYRQIQALLARAGHPVTDRRWFTPNEGVHLVYEAGARVVNRLHVPTGLRDFAALVDSGMPTYGGLDAVDKLVVAGALVRLGAWLRSHAVSTDFDEDDFAAACIGLGVPSRVTRMHWFRYAYDLAFNTPNGGSAYVGLQGFQALMGQGSSTVHYLNGPLSEVIIAPIARLYQQLGGKVRYCTKITRVELDPARRLLARFATQPTCDHAPAQPGGHFVVPLGPSALDDKPYPKGDPAPAGELSWWEHGADFDEVVWTLPVDSTRALLRTTPGFERAVLEEPQLRRIFGLRTVASMSLRMWFPRKVMPSTYGTVVMGTPQPMATIIDYTNRVDELRHGPYGSVVELEGQEGLWAELTEAEIVRECVASFASLPFVDGARVDREALLLGRGGHHLEFRRNSAHHMRYLLMEPGHWKHRPEQDRPPCDNLVLAGDWMQGTQPTASMEAAVRTGRVAADRLRVQRGLSPAGE